MMGPWDNDNKQDGANGGQDQNMNQPADQGAGLGNDSGSMPPAGGDQGGMPSGGDAPAPSAGGDQGGDSMPPAGGEQSGGAGDGAAAPDQGADQDDE